jgi:hypothetical protein
MGEIVQLVRACGQTTDRTVPIDDDGGPARHVQWFWVAS